MPDGTSKPDPLRRRSALDAVDPLNASRLAAPQPPPGAVARTRILDMIDRGLQGPLTMISAPAGTGKTVAVAQWVASRRAPGPVVWISLGEDADAERLWKLLPEGLRRIDLITGDLPPSTGTQQDAFLAALAAELVTAPAVVTVILDSAIDIPQDSADGLHQLLSCTAGRLRLITMTRADPALPLHLYRLDESVVEIRMADLAFTAAEAHDLLARRGTVLPSDIVEHVVARTRGWVVGLLMVSMSVAHARDPGRAARRLTGESGPVAGYLLAEVLSAQTPSIRDMLLRTSVVEHLRPGLVEALSGPNASRSLAFLTRGNAFLEELPATPGWYQYHPLFRELLVAQLTLDDPGEATRLHLTAAKWFANCGLTEESVRSAIAGGGWDEASETVIDALAIAQLLGARGPGRLRELLRPLPDRATSTAALLVRAALSLGRGEQGFGAEDLRTARARLATAQTPWPAADLAAAVLAALTVAAGGAAADEVVSAASEARELLDAHERGLEHPELIVLLEDAVADALFRDGRFGEAADACTAATSSAVAGFEAEQVKCLGRLAFIAAWSGHCRRAIKLAQRASAMRVTASLPRELFPLPDLALAWAYADTGDLVRAEEHASAADRAADDAPPPSSAALAPVTAIVRARMRRARDDLTGARMALLGGRRPDRAAPAWATDLVAVEEAAADLLEGRPGRAFAIPEILADPVRDLAMITRAEAVVLCGAGPAPVELQSARTSGDLAVRIGAWLIDALDAARQSDGQRCNDSLERALRLAAPEHLRRPFREAAEPIRRALSSDSELAARHGWLFGDEPASLQPAGRGRQSGATTAPMPAAELTQKEREVLSLLAQLLTTEEIAAALYVSVNTVRTHVRNVLRKLGVKGRNQAIRRARQMGVLPPVPRAQDAPRAAAAPSSTSAPPRLPQRAS